jgi:hypothetical protein
MEGGQGGGREEGKAAKLKPFALTINSFFSQNSRGKNGK